MSEDLKMVAMFLGGFLALMAMGMASCNYDAQNTRDDAHRARELDALKDKTPIVESCVKHHSARHVVVQ